MTPTPIKTGRRTATRLAAAAATVIAATLATAPAASAHTVGGVAATDYQSRIVGLAPPLPGLSARLLDLGRRIQLTNTAAADLIVLGYQGEAYLRVGPAGVFENLHSPAVSQNQVATGGSPTPPTDPQPTAAPQWQKIGTGHTVIWRDRRTRWEGPRPPAVQRDPTRVTAVATWAIPLRLGAATIDLQGRIVWVPRPSLLPWVALAVFALLLAIGVGRSRWWGPGLSALLAFLIAVDIARAYAAAAISGGSTSTVLLRTLLAGEIGVVTWVVGAVAVALLQSEREGGLLTGVAAGIGIGLFSGLRDLPYLLHSQLPVSISFTTARAGMAIATGLGVGVAVGCLPHLRHLPRAADEGLDEATG